MQIIHATYQNGVFAPVEAVELPEGSRVTLLLEPTVREVNHLEPEDKAFLDRLAVQRAEVFRRLAE